MLWDVFCRVIDNFGDIGVCWRLSADLAARGASVRLWVDDASALSWMAPQVLWTPIDGPGAGRRGLGHEGIEVRDWSDAEHLAPDTRPGDVVIEAFGCDPPAAFLARMQRENPPTWVNLEYLSAEGYVERSHGLRSPVFSGPAAGLSKRFFYPGFTDSTGGLLREPGLLAAQSEFNTRPREPWLQALGVEAQAGDHLVSVFCYGGAPLGAWLDRLAAQALDQRAMAGRTHVLLTPGHASRLGQAWHEHASARLQGALVLHHLPPLTQPDYDRLLWSCDLNVVRGEDSAVRALWAGRPHLWHIYPQDDSVHLNKLDAFMGRWLATWEPTLRGEVQAAWLALNRPEADRPTGGCPPLPEWRGADSAWRLASLASRERLLRQTDLCTRLIDFVTGSG
jgi:uncharacterized repeat protein (TIGR03837 family)